MRNNFSITSYSDEKNIIQIIHCFYYFNQKSIIYPIFYLPEILDCYNIDNFYLIRLIFLYIYKTIYLMVLYFFYKKEKTGTI